MPNEWNKVIDGVIGATSNIAQSLLKKNPRQDAEKAFSDFKKKLIASYSRFAEAQEPAPKASQASNTARLTGIAATPLTSQPPFVAEEAQVTPFEPLATYGQLMDFKTSLNKNPFSNRYTADADNLFSLLFGKDFIKKNITEKKFTPDDLYNMSFDAARAMNKRQILDSIMLLSEDVRNKLIDSNVFAKRMFQVKSRRKRALPAQPSISD